MAEMERLGKQMAQAADRSTAEQAAAQESAQKKAADLSRKAAEARVAGDVDALAKRLKLGGYKMVQEVGDSVPEAYRAQAERLARLLKGEMPKLAALAEKQNKELVRVNAKGQMEVLRHTGRGRLGYASAAGLGSGPRPDAGLSHMAGLAGGAAGGVLSGASGILSGVAGAAGSLVSGALTAGVGLAAAGIGAFTYALHSGMEKLMDDDRKARALGVTINELRTLMLAAGPAAKAMEGAIGSLTDKMVAFRMGNTEAARTFQQLGAMSGKGFDLTPDMGGLETFQKVVEQIRGISDPISRAAVATRFFGDNARDLLAEMDRGALSIDKARDMMVRFGLAAGNSDNVKAIQDAKNALSAFGQGVSNQLALGVGAIVAELTERFGKLGLSIDGMAKYVVEAGRWIAYVGAAGVEAWKGLQMMWELNKIGVKGLTAAVLEFAAWGAQGLSKVTQEVAKVSVILMKLNPAIALAMEGLKAAGIDIAQIARGGGVAAQAELEQFSKWASKTAGGLRDSALKDMGAFIDKWGKDKSAFKWVDEVFDAIQNRLKGTGADVDNLKKKLGEALAGAFKGFEDATKNPLDSFREAMKQIDLMKSADLFKGNPKQEMLFRNKAFRDLEGAVQLPEFKAPGAVMKDTREAYSAILRHERGPDTMTVQERLKALAEEANRMQAEQVKQGEEIRSYLKDLADRKDGALLIDRV
jgi:hypothetical protein